MIHSFLTKLKENEKNNKKIKNNDILNEMNVFFVKINFYTSLKKKSWKKIYERSNWFETYYFYLNQKILFKKFAKRIIEKILNHKLNSNIDFVWIHHRNKYFFCISKKKILSLLRQMHDENEHWAKNIILICFKSINYWSKQIVNVEKYIIECVLCVKHGFVTKSQSLNFVKIFHSFQLTKMNFIGSLREIFSKNKFIFHFMNYFNRNSIFINSKNVNAIDVKKAFQYIFIICKTSIKIYCDKKQHFFNEEFKQWFKSKKIKYTHSSSKFFKNIELIKSENKFFENIIRKNDNENWNFKLKKSVKFLNRKIIKHLKNFFQKKWFFQITTLWKYWIQI